MTLPPPRPSGDNSRYTRVISQTLDAAIAAVAAKQHGNVTRGQLLELGLDDDAIRRRVKAGRLFRVFPGVYAVGRPPATPLERASAAVLACGSGAALSHSSAMVLWGYWRQWETPFEVTLVGDRRPKGIRVHRSTTLTWRDTTKQLGIRVTTPGQTLLDMCPRWNDKSLKRNVNKALHSLWLTEGHLVDTLARHPHAPGANRVAKLLGLPGTPTRSGWEDDFPAFCDKYGLPAPVMGQPLLGYVADALFAAERVIVELDSREFHMGAIPFEDDRDRDADMLAHGFVTVRMTWERIEERPQREARRLHKILANQRAIHAPSAA
ncbi:MAG: type IV toxin-antitoxin system AbiEi family antitoxin domain-containing protein [Solirubrobacteraceae bacterium]